MNPWFFLDKKDGYKWSIALSQAEQRDQTILYVAMVTWHMPIDGRVEGQHTHPVVSSILKRERARQWQGKKRCLLSQRWIHKIKQDTSVDIKPLMSGFTDNRVAYMRQVRRRIHTNRKRDYFILLDPDNGIRSKQSDLHITYSEVEAIWDSMRNGDSLGLYIHNSRIPNWRANVHRKLKKVVSPSRVTQLPRDYNQMRVYVAHK